MATAQETKKAIPAPHQQQSQQPQGPVDEERLRRERSLLVFARLIGSLVTATMRDGTVIEGMFHSAKFEDPEKFPDGAVLLRCPRIVSADPTSEWMQRPLTKSLVLKWTDCMQACPHPARVSRCRGP